MLLLLVTYRVQAQNTAKSDLVPSILGGVSGYVYDNAGDPIAGAEVVLLHRLSVYGEEYAITTANSAGAYQFVGIPSGIYAVRFDVPNRCYSMQWYAQGYKFEEADELIVNANLLTNINITLNTGSCISGTIFLDDETPAHDGTVTVYERGDNLWQPVDTVPIARTGTYYTHALAPKNYRICANTTHPDAYGCFGDEVVDHAVTITLPTTTVLSGIDFLVKLDSYDGLISGVVTSKGTPLPSVEITLYSSSIGRLLYVNTGSDGHFSFEGLAADFYKLEARDPKEIYATTFYGFMQPAAISLSKADEIGIGTREVITGLDFSLVEGGSLIGKGPDLFGSSSLDYAFLYWQPESTESNKTWQWSGRMCDPNEQGEFSFDHLPPGIYRVGFGEQCFGDDDTCVTEYYGGVSDFSFAKDITIEAGNITKIDATQDFIQRQYLPIMSR